MIEDFPYLDVLLDLDHSEQVFKSDDFLEDVDIIARADETKFAAALARLQGASGFLSTGALESLAQQDLPEPEAEAMSRFVWYFARTRFLRRTKPSDYAKRTTKLIHDALGDRLASPEREVFTARLQQLLVPVPGVDRQVKAEDLVRRVGRRARSIDLVCDLRPVFDSDRSAIEGMVPVTTLRVTAAGMPGERDALEVQLSDGQVKQLCEKAENARRKLAALKAYLEKHAITVPESFKTTDGGDA